MGIAVTYDSEIGPATQGVFADVFRGEHNGHPVAIKVLRVYAISDTKMVASVIAQLCLYSEKTLLNSPFIAVLQRSRSLEIPTTPERPTVARRKSCLQFKS